MRYNPIDKTLFQKNRLKLAKRLQPKSVAIFNSNDIMPTNADGTFPFRQNNDLFYLSGIDQEETILLIYPDSPQKEFKEVLFIKKTSELIAIWEGHKHSQTEAEHFSGIKSVYWLDDFEALLPQILESANTIYLNSNEHARATSEVQTRDNRFRVWIQRHYPNKQFISVAPIMHQLRYIKEPEEIAQINKACQITENAFRRVLSFTKPGVKEYEIEAEITHEFIKNGSRGHAYQPIVASGSNSCVLHYIDNSQTCKDGELILFDFGAEYGNYNADLSRTIPANGRFTPRQKAVYNAVLRTQKYAIDELKIGNDFKTYNEGIKEQIEKELVELKLVSMNDLKNQDPNFPLYKKYFMHGTSHSLGLDVHDVDDRNLPFEAGMVFTCEPGLYIREESIGIRLENDIVITSTGNNDLMKNIPLETDEIEDLMAQKKS